MQTNTYQQPLETRPQPPDSTNNTFTQVGQRVAAEFSEHNTNLARQLPVVERELNALRLVLEAYQIQLGPEQLRLVEMQLRLLASSYRDTPDTQAFKDGMAALAQDVITINAKKSN